MLDEYTTSDFRFGVSIRHQFSENRLQPLRKVRIIDLFAGAGGFSLGFKLAGAEITHAFESDKWAVQTYAHNFPEVTIHHGDVRGFSSSEIRQVISPPPDIIIGGPPCQGFSHSNTVHKDPQDPRNSLFIDFLRFVDVLRPPICMIENVKGLLSTKNQSGQPVIEIIVNSFQALGYSASFEILDAADYGVPQRRERLFIIGLQKGMETSFRWPLVTHIANSIKDTPSLPLFNCGHSLRPYVTLWEAISDLPQCTNETYNPQESYRFEPQNEYQKILREGADDVIYNHEPMRHTPRIVERFSHINYGESEEDVPEALRPRKRGAPLELSGAVYGQNSRRQHPDYPCNTIVASAHTNYIHPFLHRNFTIREALRIQSFPDVFQMKGKRAVLSHKLSLRKGLTEDIYLDQRAQVGNAVPPLLASSLAHALLNAVEFTTSEAA